VDIEIVSTRTTRVTSRRGKQNINFAQCEKQAARAGGSVGGSWGL
jgi:hypothetical protein